MKTTKPHDTATSTAVHVMEPIDPTYPEAAPTLASVTKASGLVTKFEMIVSIYQNSRLGRGVNRYLTNRGALLAGGITYVALFSITGALTLAVTIIMGMMGRYPALRDAILSAIDSSLPGVLALDGPDSGLIQPDSLIMDSIWSIPGIIGLVVLLLSASRLMAAIKRSVRAMFGIEKPPFSFIVDKLRDFTGLLALLLGVLLTGIVSTINSSIGPDLLAFIGVKGPAAAWLTKLVTLILAGFADALVIWLLVRVVSSVKVPLKDAAGGLIIGAVLSALLRYLGTSAVKAVDSPILASFTALITVLLWVNLLARMLLIVSAFMANPPRSMLPIDGHHIHYDHVPNYVSLSDPETLTWPHHSITGSIDVDWDANPNRPPQVEQRTNYRGGLIGRFLVSRLEHHEHKQQQIKDALRR